MMPINLPDAPARHAFINDIQHNFSVIAPAGVGKTKSIVDRILNIAKNKPEMLSRLVVVTYTNKAAEEMKERSITLISEQISSAAVITEFNKAFFGTIHSFCLLLLSQHGQDLGIPASVNLLQDEDQHWLSYIRKNDPMRSLQLASHETPLLRFIDYTEIFNVAKKIHPSELENTNKPLPFFTMCLDQIYEFEGTKRNQVAINEAQSILQSWQERFEKESGYLPIPEYKKGGAEFQEFWNETFQPIKNAISLLASKLIYHVAQDYQNHRIRTAQIRYDDMVDLAHSLLKIPAVLQSIQNENYSIILDEAQDTDKTQFHILLSASGINPSSLLSENNGRFCMVGDPQQAIFSSRADLPTYLSVHNNLVQNKTAHAVEFTVTMRCEVAIVDAINSCFPKVLSSSNRLHQVNFTQLSPKPGAGQGAVTKWKVIIDQFPNTDAEAAELESRFLAKQLKELGHFNLGANDWSQVAILAPRNKWLAVFAKNLDAAGLKCQIHSSNAIYGDSPAYAWAVALLAIAANPIDSFEIAGVLREIFFASDNDLFIFSSNGNTLSINTPHSSSCELSKLLTQLHNIYEESQNLSLRNTVSLWFEKTNLLHRLKNLPNVNPTECERILNEFLIKASNAEKTGNTLSAWVKELRLLYKKDAPIHPPKKGHIQLISCHKSKGLEWPVVIMPCLFRPIKAKYPTFPRIVKGANTRFVIDKSQVTLEDSEYEKDKAHSELERLLYVAMTRPKNHLILFDSESLYKKTENSFADFLQILPNLSNHFFWNGISSNNSAHFSKLNPPASQPESNLSIAFPKQSLESGILASKKYIRRITPSSLAEEKTSTGPQTESSLNPQDAALSVEYGNWWHLTMETATWTNPASLNEHLSNSLTSCPIPTRGLHEIQLFLKSDCLSLLQTDAPLIMPETPFLWKKDEFTCIEGIIDCLAFSQTSAHSFIIDWKTDFINEQSIPDLIAKYHNQISLYAKAINAIYKLPSTTYIYSTHQGQLIKLQ